nr:hypothetical protein [Paracoccus mutanolyticus]
MRACAWPAIPTWPSPGQAGRERIVSGFGAEAGAETLIRLMAETRG